MTWIMSKSFALLQWVTLRPNRRLHRCPYIGPVLRHELTSLTACAVISNGMGRGPTSAGTVPVGLQGPAATSARRASGGLGARQPRVYQADTDRATALIEELAKTAERRHGKAVSPGAQAVLRERIGAPRHGHDQTMTNRRAPGKQKRATFP
jgi:hypothetical protein